jgi:hypothetical protein
MTITDAGPMTSPVVSRRSTALLIGILMLVNSAAIWGQAGWALEHIVPAQWDWRAGLALALGFAAALELIGVFLATMADEAEARHQPAGGIRLGSYAVGLVSGALNLSHWGVWTAAAAAFGFLSAVSPFLWGIYSRVRRGRPIAPSRRFWHPVAAVRLIRFMAWHGLTDELAAIEALAESTRGGSNGQDRAEDHGQGDPREGVIPDGGRGAEEDPPGAAGDVPEQQEEVAAAPVNLSRPRKPHTTNPDRVRRAYERNPAADPAAIARRLNLSLATVKKYRPPKEQPEKVNGKVPDLEGAK